MNTYTNAVGYLIDLREDVNEPWFTKICDLVLDSDSELMDGNDIAVLVNDFIENKVYTSIFDIQEIPNSNLSSSSANPMFRIDFLNDFKNFKGISSSLNIEFPKRITIFFGTNGSGKSSICEVFKLLGTSNIPDTPIKNVKQINSTIPPSFHYQFSSMATSMEWNDTEPYGLWSSSLK